MSGPSKKDEAFYVGYLPNMPATLARFITAVVVILLVCLAALAYAVPALHDAYADARSDFRDLREFEGILLAEPAPHLVVIRPGETGGRPFSRYPLVGRGKSGPKIDVEALAGKRVQILGSLIYHGSETLVSVRSAEALPVADAGGVSEVTGEESLGEFTLRGEIADSKCYAGTMRPGHSKVHRGCAVRCILGGIPPLLLARDQDGNTLSFLLVAADGSSVNDQVTHIVAEPVEITGQVIRMDDLFVLRADPATYRRL